MLRRSAAGADADNAGHSTRAGELRTSLCRSLASGGLALDMNVGATSMREMTKPANGTGPGGLLEGRSSRRGYHR